MSGSKLGKESFPTRFGRREVKKAAIKHASRLAKFQVLPRSSNLMDISIADPQVVSAFLQDFPL